jgi:hypothetical protein
MSPIADSIRINNVNPNINIAGGVNSVLDIQAFVIAPTGGMQVTDATTTPPITTDYSFRGALILGLSPQTSPPNTPPRLIYNPTANPAEYYGWMSTLASRPPPYIPGFTNLQFWHEEYK